MVTPNYNSNKSYNPYDREQVPEPIYDSTPTYGKGALNYIPKEENKPFFNPLGLSSNSYGSSSGSSNVVPVETPKSFFSMPSDESIAQYQSYGGMASQLGNMGIGGLAGTGIGATFGGPVGAVVGGTIGGIIDKGIAVWQDKKQKRALAAQLQKRQDMNDRIAAADRAELAKQFKMNYALSQKVQALNEDKFQADLQQQGFNQTKSRAEFRLTAWQNHLANLRNQVASNSNLRTSLINAGII